MAMIAIFLFVITYLSVPCQSLGKMLGPADVIYKSFARCETNEREVDVWITQKKYNRSTNVLDIKLASPWPIDDDMIMELTADIKKEGGYKPGSFHMKDTMCNVLSTILGSIFDEFLKVTGSENCPIAEGEYELKDFYVDNENFNVPAVYGDYRMMVQIFNGDDLKGCYFIFGDMVPKDSKE